MTQSLAEANLPLRVLVVDDEVNIAELISMALRYEGWQVQMAHTGGSVVNAARELGPDAPNAFTEEKNVFIAH